MCPKMRLKKCNYERSFSRVQIIDGEAPTAMPPQLPEATSRHLQHF